jgi:reactive chlorine resistance protein C
MMKLSDASDPDSYAGIDAGLTVQGVGSLVLRYGLVLVIAWIGLMKFTEYEAKGIQPLVAHSPLMGWMYGFLTVPAFSDALGVVEVAIAILIALRHWSAKASALGSGAAVLMFLTTLSFLLSTPGWEPSLGGFPSLSALPGQFLLKDVVLLGAAIWSFGESWTSIARIHRKRNACHESGSGSQDREILTDREEDASIY